MIFFYLNDFSPLLQVICRRSQVSLQIKFLVVTRGAGAGVEGVDQQVSLVEPWLPYTVCPRYKACSLIQVFSQTPIKVCLTERFFRPFCCINVMWQLKSFLSHDFLITSLN